MRENFSDEDRAWIARMIRQRYRGAAGNPKEGRFRYPTGKEGLRGLQYSERLMDRLPPEVLNSYCGVGNPFSMGSLEEGEILLDIGCGSGVDALFAAMMSGPKGFILGIDSVPEMIKAAQNNLRSTPLDNVQFLEASGDSLPFQRESFHVVISNGAFNLIPEKLKALQEVFRVLKPNGRFMIADQVLTADPPQDKQAILRSWAR